jgi:uncharacterized protein YacL
MYKVSLRGLTSIVFGLLLGILMAKLIADIITLIPLGQEFQSAARVILTVIFSYLGGVMAIRGKDEFHLIIPYIRLQATKVRCAKVWCQAYAMRWTKTNTMLHCLVNMMQSRSSK